MRYILAEHDEEGLKTPREVTAEVAQEAYERHCGATHRMYAPECSLPQVSMFARSKCLSNGWGDFLWVLVD